MLLLNCTLGRLWGICALTKKEETSTLCSSNVVGLLPTGDADTSAFDALTVRSSFTPDHHHHTFFVILSSFHHPPLSPQPQLHSGSGIKFHHFLVLVNAIITDRIKSGQAWIFMLPMLPAMTLLNLMMCCECELVQWQVTETTVA